MLRLHTVIDNINIEEITANDKRRGCNPFYIKQFNVQLYLWGNFKGNTFPGEVATNQY